MNSVQSEKSETSPELAATARLLRRRRVWLWTLAGSVVAWVVADEVLGWDGKATRTAVAAVAATFVLLLTVVFVAALVMSVVHTVRLRRISPDVRARARGK